MAYSFIYQRPGHFFIVPVYAGQKSGFRIVREKVVNHRQYRLKVAQRHAAECRYFGIRADDRAALMRRPHHAADNIRLIQRCTEQAGK